MVCVHVAGCDGRDTERSRKLFELCIAASIATLVWTLELDVERALERPRELHGCFRICRAEPLPRAAGERDEALCVLGEHIQRRPGRQQVAFLARQTCACMCVGEDAAEIRVA